MTWGTLEEEVMECFQRPQWQCGAAKVAASRGRESWIPRRKKHNCSSTTWEGSMEQAPSKHPRGPGEPFMCGSPPSFAPRGRGHILITKRGLSMSPPRCPCPVFCMYLSVEACLSPSLPFAVFALRLVGCDNVCCSSLVLSITAGSGRFPAVNSQSIYVPFGLVNSKKRKEGPQ